MKFMRRLAVKSLCAYRSTGLDCRDMGDWAGRDRDAESKDLHDQVMAYDELSPVSRATAPEPLINYLPPRVQAWKEDCDERWAKRALDSPHSPLQQRTTQEHHNEVDDGSGGSTGVHVRCQMGRRGELVFRRSVLSRVRARVTAIIAPVVCRTVPSIRHQ